MVSYIYTNVLVNAIVRVPHAWSGDSQDQKTFLETSADKQTRIYIFIDFVTTKCKHKSGASNYCLTNTDNNNSWPLRI